ncbi:hypothetical protein MNBD_GAMMA07-2441 [hydrothermal vent metagenome]|uniref:TETRATRICOPEPTIDE REPEAT FAMILY PROTEIN n=1 Tax=hydrothermal vent metagenome TaxID=652676 RepID=A0A3B0WLM1_9ZZZZ
MMLAKMKFQKWPIILYFLVVNLLLSTHAATNNTSEYVLRYQKQMAKRGSAPAQFKLGLMYEAGLGTKTSTVLANSWFKQAARQKYKPAINRITYLKIKKTGFKDTDLKWLKNLKRDALLHQGEALFLLGLMYSEGTGVEKSLTRALSLLREAEAKNISGSGTEINRIDQELSLLQEKYITEQEKAKTKYLSTYSSKKKSIYKIKKAIIVTTASPKKVDHPNKPTNKKHKIQQHYTKQQLAKPQISARKIIEKKIVNDVPTEKKIAEKPGLVIKISKPNQLSEIYTPHPMDVICSGKNQFRRRCR